MKDSWFFSSSSIENSSWLSSSSSRCSISFSLMSTCRLVLFIVADSLIFSDSKIRNLKHFHEAVWGVEWEDVRPVPEPLDLEDEFLWLWRGLGLPGGGRGWAGQTGDTEDARRVGAGSPAVDSQQVLGRWRGREPWADGDTLGGLVRGEAPLVACNTLSHLPPAISSYRDSLVQVLNLKFQFIPLQPLWIGCQKKLIGFVSQTWFVDVKINYKI